MKTSDQFLLADIKQAATELKCAYDLLGRLGEKIAQNDYEGAVSAAEAIIRSSRELEEMKKRKERHDHYSKLLTHLKQQGVNAELVIKYGSPYYGQ